MFSRNDRFPLPLGGFVHSSGSRGEVRGALPQVPFPVDRLVQSPDGMGGDRLCFSGPLHPADGLDGQSCSGWRSRVRHPFFDSVFPVFLLGSRSFLSWCPRSLFTHLCTPRRTGFVTYVDTYFGETGTGGSGVSYGPPSD